MIESVDGEIVVKRHPESVPEVRRFVRVAVGRWGRDDFLPCLVASELVTNAIHHGTAIDDDVTVRLGVHGDGALWLEVQDTNSAQPTVQEPDLTSESGRGLYIVEQVVRRWGVRPSTEGAGKVVFAVLDP